MSDPKKTCETNDCPFLPKGDKDQEETEIKTVDLCNDPECSNTHEKKLVDLTQGLSQLENILKNMTGLCREPKCPSKSPSVQQRIQDSIPPFPKPNRYPPEDTGKDDPDRPKRDITDLKSCKGTICYSAYMGHKIEAKVKEPPPHVCDSQSCVPKPVTPKKVCACPTCPFSRKKDPDATDFDLSTRDYNKPTTTSMGPCGGFTCPPPKNDLFTTYKAPTNLFDFTSTLTSSPANKPCTFETCPLDTQQEKEQVPVGLCGRTSCPFASLEYAQRLEGLRPNTPVNFNFGDTGQTSVPPCSNASCPYSTQKSGPAAPCGNASCPYGSQKTGLGGASGAAPCGNTSCPYGTSSYGAPQQTGPPLVGICGRTSCPFAAITPNVKARTTAPCGNPCCSYGETSYDPVGLCGQIECPMLTKTSPGAIKPCPYADKIKRYPCGSPSCTFVNPEGMLQTHEYTTDRSYVREAARPYAGSASPYDYMSSLQQSYNTPYATNYPLFSYTKPPTPLPPCPFLPKKVFKSCGKPTCPYADGKRPKDDFCIESTCPYGEGICGGPRRFSCDNPNVIYCESPDCQVPQKKNGNGNGKCHCCGGSLPDSEEDLAPRSCCRAGSKSSKKERKEKKRKIPTCCRMPEVEEEGLCNAPKQFSCESPNVEHCETDDCKVPKPDDCGRPDCRKSKNRGEPKKRKPSNATTRSLISGMSLEEFEGMEGFMKQKETDPGKCTSKTCPYLKKLVFCDDCGGVLPDEDTPESSTETTVDSAEGNVGSMEGEIETSSTAIQKVESGKKSLDAVVSPTKAMKGSKDGKYEEPKEEEEPLPVVKTVSLYQYPGVQIGHKDCGYRRRMIPRNMGWLWNIIPAFGNPELWRGYKPGAICKTVYKMMMEHRRKAGLIDTNPKKKKRLKFEDLKHCIEVKKKEGDYTITVNPVKDPKTRDPMDNPYMDVTPIQFKVEKEQTEKEPAYCPCDEVSDQPSAHSSEFEFHFTPPAAIPETVLKKKKTLVEAVVQYDCMDLPPDIRSSCKSMGKKGKGKGKGGGKGKKGKKK